MTEAPSPRPTDDLGRCGSASPRAAWISGSRRLLRRRPAISAALGDVHRHHTGTAFVDQITELTGSKPGRGGLVTLNDFGLGAVVVELPSAGNHRPAAWHQNLVGLRLFILTDRRLRQEAHGSVHRQGYPGRDAAAVAVRQAVRRDHGVSICVPCYLPYVQQRLDAPGRGDRPPDRSRKGPSISVSSASTSNMRRRWRSPSNLPARPGKRSTPLLQRGPRRRR